AYSFQPKQYIAIFDDITDQVKAQEAIIESEEKFRALFKSLNTGVVVNNVLQKKDQKPEYIVEMINPAFEKTTGIPGKKIISKHFLNVLSENGIDITDWMETTAKEKISETDLFWEKQNKYLRLTTFPLQKKQRIVTITDITKERNEYISRNHLASIVESSEDAIYSISPDGIVISWNKGAENFYGFKHEEIIGKRISVLHSNEEDDEIHKELLERVKMGKTVKNFELLQKKKNGKNLPVSLTKSPIKNEKGEVIAISDVVKDMTKVKAREKELIDARQKSVQASMLKTNFLQNISHEIRTPMNSIIGFTDILKSKVDSKNLKFMTAIEESGHQLMRLIDDILDLSRLESGELSVEKNYFDLDELLEHLKNQFITWKKSKGKKEVKLLLELPDSEHPIHLYTDRDRFQQIISNLLSNAIKYTQQGHVKFGYENKEKFIQFYVKDTGKGIQAKHLDKIFDRFERAGIESEDVFSGTGLGLSISKGLAEMLGGRIWCESEVDKGSTFYLTIPNEVFRKPVEKKDEITQQNTTVPDLKGKTILIAEDDEFSAQMMQFMLEPTNATLKFATDGEKAIKFFHEIDADLALLDIRLPRKDGFEIVKEIRKTDKNIPIVAQSAYAMPDDRKKILENGFNGYLEKPLTTAKLYHILAKYLLNGKA
ncbi:MAG TPA: ATP-binding protein, partial [Prolixibacteraceae bacterium]|nr:ATP-binding protein [Prolixibacteraceae bacterium]